MPEFTKINPAAQKAVFFTLKIIVAILVLLVLVLSVFAMLEVEAVLELWMDIFLKLRRSGTSC